MAVTALFSPPLPSLIFTRGTSSQPGGYVNENVVNQGLGPGQNIKVTAVTIKMITPASGVAVASNAMLPLSLGTIAVNGTGSFALPVTWPAAARRFSIALTVTAQDTLGNSYSFTPQFTVPS